MIELDNYIIAVANVAIISYSQMLLLSLFSTFLLNSLRLLFVYKIFLIYKGNSIMLVKIFRNLVVESFDKLFKILLKPVRMSINKYCFANHHCCLTFFYKILFDSFNIAIWPGISQTYVYEGRIYFFIHHLLPWLLQNNISRQAHFWVGHTHVQEAKSVCIIPIICDLL